MRHAGLAVALLLTGALILPLTLAHALPVAAAPRQLVLRLGGERLDAAAHLVAQVAIAEQRSAGGDATAELGIVQCSGGAAVVEEAHGVARAGLVALGLLIRLRLLRLLLLLLLLLGLLA